MRVVFGGVTIADTTAAVRVLETSHPPVYYVPPADIAPGVLTPVDRSTWCEWKGAATYLDARAGGRHAPAAAWRYEHPSPGFAAMTGYVAFYAQAMDVCEVGGEEVTPQPGGFYGGWVTSWVVGPFKGVPGSVGW